MAATSILEALAQREGEHRHQGAQFDEVGKSKPAKKKPQEGGRINGPGTGTSDSIRREVEDGSFIMPADSTAEIGPESLQTLQGAAMQSGMGDAPAAQGADKVALSNGEFEFTKEQIYNLGLAVLEQARQQTHTPTGMPPVTEDGLMAFADGGVKREDEDRAVAGASGVVRNGNTYSDAPAPNTINTGRVTPAGAAPEIARPAQPVNPNHVNTGPITPASEAPRSIAGAAGVTRTGNSYADTPASPSSPLVPKVPAPQKAADAPQGFAAWATSPNPALSNPGRTYLPTQGELANRAQQGAQGWQEAVRGGPPQLSSGLADQIPGASNSEIQNAASAMAPRPPAQRVPLDAPPKGSLTEALQNSPTVAYMKDKDALTREMLNKGNYAGALGNFVGAGVTGAGMAGLEVFDETFGNLGRAMTNPQGAIARFAGGALGTDTAEGIPIAQAEAQAQAAQQAAQQERANQNAQRQSQQGDNRAAMAAVNPQTAPALAQPATSLSQAAQQAQTNQVRRVGNSYSADGPVAGDIQVNGQTPRGGFATAAAGAGSFMNAANSVLNPNNTVQARAANAQEQAQYRQEVQRAQAINAMRPPAGDTGNGLLAESRRADRSDQIAAQRVMDEMRAAPPGAVNGMASAYQEGNRRRIASEANTAANERAAIEQGAAGARQDSANATRLAEVGMRESTQRDRNQAEERMGLREMAVRESEAEDTAAVRAMEIQQARQMQSLREQYANAGNETERAAIAKRMNDLSGVRDKQEDLTKNYMTAGGGQAVNSDGQLMTLPTRLIDLRTGQEVGGGQRVTPPTGHIAELQKNPSASAIENFNKIYGNGAAELYLKK